MLCKNTCGCKWICTCEELTMAQTQNNIEKTSSRDLLACGNGKGETFFDKKKKKRETRFQVYRGNELEFTEITGLTDQFRNVLVSDHSGVIRLAYLRLDKVKFLVSFIGWLTNWNFFKLLNYFKHLSHILQWSSNHGLDERSGTWFFHVCVWWKYHFILENQVEVN